MPRTAHLAVVLATASALQRTSRRKAGTVAKKKMTTNEALESLLGKKAAKRLRQLARQVIDIDNGSAKKKRR